MRWRRRGSDHQVGANIGIESRVIIRDGIGGHQMTRFERFDVRLMRQLAFSKHSACDVHAKHSMFSISGGQRNHAFHATAEQRESEWQKSHHDHQILKLRVSGKSRSEQTGHMMVWMLKPLFDDGCRRVAVMKLV
jgi:hypothetical protein